MNKTVCFIGIFTLFLFFSCSTITKDKVVEHSVKKEVANPLPSWNEGKIKSSIIEYVNKVTDSMNVEFIPVGQRIATFDNDGTLWSEQPLYFQLFFVMDRIKDMAPEHPEWKTEQPFKAVLENNREELLKQGEHGLMKLLMATHAGNTSVEFEAEVRSWIKTAKHPSKNVGYDELVYQPMLELLEYLRANEFKTYVVSGGGIDFMRPIISEIYGIPNEQIIGSRIKTEFDYNNGKPQIRRVPELEFINDKGGKPINIQKIIGVKPVFAAGNSDGDLQMLQWTASNKYKSFMLYVHHTDSVREWVYDRTSHIGRLDKGLDEAIEKDWAIVDMAADWKVIYPFEL